MKINNLYSAIKLFEKAANSHGLATELGDYKTANKCYKIIFSAIEFIKAEDGIDNLLQFLDSTSVGVKLWASTYILPKHEKRGIEALKEISKQNGIHSLTADTTLSEWRKGNLHL